MVESVVDMPDSIPSSSRGRAQTTSIKIKMQGYLSESSEK
jgi:hypothetical protein